MVQFKWIFLVDTMVIIGSVLSFGAIAAFGLDMQEENAILMLCMIPPMILTTAASTFVILHFIRRRMDELLDGIRAVGNGDMDVRLEPKGADEYREIYKSFNAMVAELKATKEEMKAFTNEFSHEFKTPITSIQGFAQYLVNTGQDIESPERMKYLRVIADESMRLAELSQNTLLLSKVEACQIITDKEDFNLSEQIKRCSILFLAQMERKKINVKLDLPEYMKYHGNAEFLEQVWINLLNNAVKFMPENGSLLIKGGINEEGITVSIADNGVGMDGETAAHIFEKYYQGGGSIEVASEPGVGNTFTVRLPA